MTGKFSANAGSRDVPSVFPMMRKSRCVQESFADELRRLHSMSIKERVQEALGMADRFSWMDLTKRMHR